ncbi:hypothetical protein HK097_000096 [Rhizophlyctis rosea]|uniref:sn-1-specific diacylglycerol lipase n=1 Tax=Rhizophlyctis rosea TaxID=64517 RepID=A0AAD5X8G6_9FUNG|nr:hypothetical protein HK097_000096 [Rhizophlyctis rosea]
MVVELIVEVAMVALSMSGTVNNKGPRRFVSPLVHIHLFLAFCEIVVQSYGIHLAFVRHILTFPLPDECPTAINISALTLLRLVVIWGFLALMLYSITLLLFLIASKTKNPTGNDMNKYTALWRRRFKQLLLRGGGRYEETVASDEVMRDVAGEFADFFKDVDWSASDVAVGLILLKREQKRVMEAKEAGTLLRVKKKRLAGALRDMPSHGSLSTIESGTTLASDVPLTEIDPRKPHPARPMLSPSYGRDSPFTEPPLTRDDLAEMIHYSHYAEIVYNHAEYSALGPELIVRASPQNDWYKAPYMVCLDHDRKKVIIAVRGTYSMVDLLVDLKIALEPVPFIEDPTAEGKPVEVEWCHSGVYKTVENIMQDIREDDVFGKLREMGHENYGIVLCGHSLGGGVAALLAYYLWVEGYRDIHCYAFEPPGCLATTRLAKFMDQFVTSVVLGDDFIARLGRNSMEILKSDISRVLASCHVPKWQVFGGALGACCFPRYRKKRLRWEEVKDGQWRRLHKDDMEQIVGRVRSLPRRWRRKMSVFINEVEQKAEQVGGAIQNAVNTGRGTTPGPADSPLPEEGKEAAEADSATERASSSAPTLTPPPSTPITSTASSSSSSPPLSSASSVSSTPTLVSRPQHNRTISTFTTFTASFDDLEAGPIAPVVTPPLHLPGRILYIEKLRDFGGHLDPTTISVSQSGTDPYAGLGATDPLRKIAISTKTLRYYERRKDRKYVYVPRWADRNEFQEIIVSRSMISDHSPWAILREFEGAPAGWPLRTTS